ncbi:hypothetical protein ACIMK4_001389 [Campylobacter upsaliensis]
MIECSKSFFGYVCLPYVLYYIKSTHKKENLETTQQFLDYEEAQNVKNHLSYKLGQGLLQRTRGGGGIMQSYIALLKFWIFDVKKIKKEFYKTSKFLKTKNDLTKI